MRRVKQPAKYGGCPFEGPDLWIALWTHTGRSYRVGGGYVQKKTANRYLLRFDNLDIETRASVVISPSGD